MLKISLHPQAIVRWNEEARNLISELSPDESGDERPDWVNNERFHEPIQPLEVTAKWHMDDFGGEHGRVFWVVDERAWIGIQGESYKRLVKFIEKLAARREFNKIVRQKFIQDKFFDWLRINYAVGDVSEFMPFLLNACEAEVIDHVVSVPIDYMSIEESFDLLGVRFEVLGRSVFDAFEAKLVEEDKGFDVSALMKDYRRGWQGLVYGTVRCNAEEGRALEVAAEKVDAALSVLRVFSPLAFLVHFPPNFGRKGKVNMPEAHYLIRDGEVIRTSSRIAVVPSQFELSKAGLARMRKMGMDELEALKFRDAKSEFEDAIENSISIFSHALTRRDLDERLLLILVSLESFLLVDNQEPIVTQLGLRLAFLRSNDVMKRKKTIDLLKEAYGLRSRFVHHGKTSSDKAIVEGMQHIAYDVLVNALKNRSRFQTRKQLTDFIADMIIS